jgi:hypothetical protein
VSTCWHGALFDAADIFVWHARENLTTVEQRGACPSLDKNVTGEILTHNSTFVDHRGLVVNFPWGALARLGLARFYAMQGDAAKARVAFQDFLTLWKDADPDIPILKQAKAEYAKLL